MPSPDHEPDADDAAPEDIRNQTASGRTYTKKRWTFGSSMDLVEGQTKEPWIVAAGWIVVPTLIALLLVAWMASHS